MATQIDDDGDVIGVVTDQWGRLVVLSARRLAHVHSQHHEVGERDIKVAIRRADTRTRGNRPNAEVLWCREVGVSRWMKVVVAYDGGEGRVLTAYPSKTGPSEGTQIE